MTAIYAIVETGGKQYRVTEGLTLDVELLGVPEGDTVELDKVLLIGGESGITVGAPYVEGAKVVADVAGEVKGEKIIVFKYKSKVRYRRKTGHRQHFTRIQIKSIQA